MSEDARAVAEIADEVWQHKLETQTFVRILRGLPVTELRSMGLETMEEDASFARRILSRLDGLDLGSLSHDDVLTASFIRHTQSVTAEAPDYYWFAYTVTPYTLGLWVTPVGQRLFAPFVFEGTDSLERYVSLVADFARLIQEAGEKITGQVERGIYIPRPAIPSARATLQQMSAVAPGFLVPSDERLSPLGGEAGAAKEHIHRLVSEEVVPAFAKAEALLDDDYVANAPESVGIGQFPGGVDAYRFAIRFRNSLDIEPDRVHEIGLEEVAKLSEQMAAVRSEMGFTGSEAEFHVYLKKEPSLYASTPEEVEASYLSYMARLEPLLGEYFSVLPKAPYGVKRLLPHLEPGMTYGYYEPPTPDEPVGHYHYNGSQLDKRSLLNAAAIIYHELAPGHHFHIARQRENESLPDVRREAFEIGAFNEGWAEYASGLALEMGIYTEPLEKYGRLAHERFIAQRLVIDTGMNVLGWSLEHGREYMRENTFESDEQIASETLRYSTDLPAQALGYRLGHLTILGARKRAEAALGDAFDIRDFHEAVLGPGALPLTVLEEHIDWFIADRSPA